MKIEDHIIEQNQIMLMAAVKVIDPGLSDLDGLQIRQPSAPRLRGDLGVWLIILAELLTFGIFFVTAENKTTKVVHRTRPTHWGLRMKRPP